MIMGACLTTGTWGDGFRALGFLQLAVVVVLTVSLPLWRDRKLPKGSGGEDGASAPGRRSRRELLRTDGVVAVLVSFFCYCALESTCGNWASSYCTLAAGVSAETAASWASLFYIGITVGRRRSCGLTAPPVVPPRRPAGRAGGGIGRYRCTLRR